MADKSARVIPLGDSGIFLGPAPVMDDEFLEEIMKRSRYRSHSTTKQIEFPQDFKDGLQQNLATVAAVQVMLASNLIIIEQASVVALGQILNQACNNMNILLKKHYDLTSDTDGIVQPKMASSFQEMGHDESTSQMLEHVVSKLFDARKNYFNSQDYLLEANKGSLVAKTNAYSNLYQGFKNLAIACVPPGVL